MTVELWSSIKDFPGYEVSSHGRIKSIDYSKAAGFIILKPWDSSGYPKVCLQRNQKRHKKFVHILVAEAFVKNPDNLPEVNHKDGVRSNAVADNLEWVSSRGNKIHARNVLGVQHGEPARKVSLINRVTGQKFDFVSVAEAARGLHLSRTNLTSVLTGSRKSVGGFVATYSEN